MNVGRLQGLLVQRMMKARVRDGDSRLGRCLVGFLGYHGRGATVAVAKTLVLLLQGLQIRKTTRSLKFCFLKLTPLQLKNYYLL
jgi:hypothetical protein